MLVFRNPAAGSRELGYVRAALERGELAVIPTDTVYGIAALAASEEACGRLYDAKGRSSTQPTAVVCSSFEDLVGLLPAMSDRAGAACEVLLPGPYTLIVRNSMHAVPWLCGTNPDAIGIRLPEHALALPPVAATSANLPGQPEIARVDDLPAQLADQVVCAVDGGELPAGNASTVLDLTGWEWGADPVVRRDAADRAAAALDALAQL